MAFLQKNLKMQIWFKTFVLCFGEESKRHIALLIRALSQFYSEPIKSTHSKVNVLRPQPVVTPLTTIFPARDLHTPTQRHSSQISPLLTQGEWELWEQTPEGGLLPAVGVRAPRC